MIRWTDDDKEQMATKLGKERIDGNTQPILSLLRLIMPAGKEKNIRALRSIQDILVKAGLTPCCGVLTCRCPTAASPMDIETAVITILNNPIEAFTIFAHGLLKIVGDRNAKTVV